MTKFMTRIARTVITLVIVSLAARAQAVSEYQIKSLFIYNFVKFVDWPPDAFLGPHDPVDVCIIGQDPFGVDLDQAVKGKTVGLRELVIKRIGKSEEAKGCQILFVPSSERKHAKAILSALNSAAVLTVGEGEGFCDSGGIINFVMEGNKVRFDINLESAEHSRIKISSKLLTLARSVKEAGK